MLTQTQRNSVRSALLLLLVIAVGLFIPPYKSYCESAQANQKYCVVYETTAALASFFDSNMITAIATAFIALFTVALFLNAKNQLAHNRSVQRAYVKMSHTPPGIEVKGDTGLIYINMGIKNYGNTPAEVTDIFFKPAVISPKHAPLPKDPDYSGDRTVFPKAFLVAQDEFSVF